MEEVATIQQALAEMSSPDVTESHRWNMLHLALEFMARQQGCDMFLNMRDHIHELRGIWHCGCGHWNGCNLAVCADCGRKPNESR
jgi:hypothetical protein